MVHSGWLLDVNSIIALLDPLHVHHEPMHNWFARRKPKRFGMSPLAENGVVRVLSGNSYPSGKRNPNEVISALEQFKECNVEDYRFVPDSISLCDPLIFVPQNLTGPKQVTDLYLAGLAFVNQWKLVTFDRSVPWQAVRGADASLIEIPAIG